MTAVNALHRQQQSRTLVSLCIGVGQGVALALETDVSGAVGGIFGFPACHLSGGICSRTILR